jgi:F0F1-type ATP synthase membrane subunit c/vacuolar-type H+-ATPase subunit K
MRKALEIGGFVAAAVLIAFGVVAIVMGVNGRQTVNNSLSHEYIVAGSDMTPSAIKAEAQKAGIASAVKQWPTMSIAGKAIDTGPEAQAMAQYMHIHALEATGGYTYAQMGIYQAKPGTPKSQLMVGGGTDNTDFAATDPTTKQPVQNGARQVWISETALTNALNMSQLASQISLFGIVVGIALLLTGIGFAIIAGAGALRNPETVLSFARKPKLEKVPAVPVA